MRDRERAWLADGWSKMLAEGNGGCWSGSHGRRNVEQSSMVTKGLLIGKGESSGRL